MAALATTRAGVLRIDTIGQQVSSLAEAFAAAEPFPHAVIDDCLRVERESISSFPDVEWRHWRSQGDTYQHEKRSCQRRAVLPAPWGQLLDDLNSAEFLVLLERITGIPKLLPDPYLEGGGLHLSMPGGILAPHTDFHLYDRLDVYRRLNALIYLNPDWSPGDGGELVLSHSRRPDLAPRRIEPIWGRMVIFETNDISVHGFPEPVAAGRCRRSVAVYYYTARETPGFSGDYTTHWREHGSIARRQRLRFLISRALLQVSRGFSLLGHLANPHQGRAWWRTRQRRQAGDDS